MERIHTEGTRFVDEYGRERIFSGMNVCDKEHFGTGKTDFQYTPEEFPFERFQELGFNIIRLGFTWSVVEPQPGVYNNKFLTSVGKFMDKCAEHGIYTYLDMHQDLYSHYCYGDGAPRWATITDGHQPYKPRFVWAEPYFFGNACHRAFDNFWANRPINGKGLQDYFAAAWKHIAERFKDHPALFGYDMLNEPFPGTPGGKVFRTLILNLAGVTAFDGKVKKSAMLKELMGEHKPRLLDQYDADAMRKITQPAKEIVNKFDTEKYSPFLSKTASAIREATDNGIMFIENCYYSNLGIPCANTPVTVNGKRDADQCFSPHGYDFMVDTPAYKYANNSRVGFIFDEHRRTQERLGVPVIVGEWGGGSNGTDWFPHVEFLLNKFESNKWGNTYWAYTDGCVYEPLAEVISRPYPKAVTGVTDNYHFDKDAKTFTLTYTQDNGYTVPTVIFSPFPVKSVETDGEYEIKPIGKAYEVFVTTETGAHTIKLSF